MVFGRMNRDWNVERTQRAASLFARQLATAYPASNANNGVILLPARNGFDHPTFFKPRVLVLASSLGIFASIVVLLIICANLANLQLARATARAREIAIRLALGSSRGRLIRQFLVESFVFTIPGLVLAGVLVSFSAALEPFMLPHLQFQVGLDARPDLRVVAFTTVVGLVAVALFSLAPAFRASRPDLAGALASVIGERRRAMRLRLRTRDLLVVSQLALSVILLVVGTLFVRSLLIAREADLGFDPDNRLLLSVNVGLQGYDEAKGRRFYDEVITRTRELPAVAGASWAMPVPFDTYDRSVPLYVEGLRTSARTPTVSVALSVASEGFVPALGLRLIDGREFTVGDSAHTPYVMVVSQSLATQLWPGKNPIGQRARHGSPSGPEIIVVGVVGDAKFATVGDVNPRRAYLSLRQQHRDWQTLVVHTRGEPIGVLRDIKRIVAGVDPTLPTFGFLTMEKAVSGGLASSRTAAMVAGFFGAVALLVAAVGLYAVVASGVTARTREIGVRLALGCTPGGVLRFVMGSGGRIGAWGLAIGLIASAGVARAMSSLLLGLSPNDPLTFAAVPLALAIVVLIATYLPARRAVRLDPVAALRSE
jgi:predicted permease